MNLETKLSKVYGIIERDYNRHQLLDWVMEMLDEKELDIILTAEGFEPCT